MGLLDWSSLFCLATWWWVRPPPIMQGAHQSRNGACVMLLSLPLCWFAPPDSPIWRCQFFFTIDLSSFLISHLVASFFNTIQFCLFSSFRFSILCCLTSAQCCRPYKLVECGLTSHCPCQLKTGPVSSKQIHIFIVYTPLFTSSLITVPSRVFRMCGFISSSTTIFPARTTFCIVNEKFGNIRTSECYAPLNSLVCLEKMFFSPKSLICSPFAPTTNFFGDDLRSNLTHGNIVSGITWPAAPDSVVTLTFTHLSLTSTFFGLKLWLLSTLNSDAWLALFTLFFVSCADHLLPLPPFSCPLPPSLPLPFYHEFFPPPLLPFSFQLWPLPKHHLPLPVPL